jgi:hypothetical protein
MTDFLAIASLTSGLCGLLHNNLGDDASGIDITSRPPDKARENLAGKSQINLFLYHMAPDAAWRNMDNPGKSRSGERSYPLLPLKLYYLMTAYSGGTEDGIDSTTVDKHLIGNQRLLGRGMSIFHDHPMLDASTINDMLPETERIEHPFDQIERVRITLQPLSLEESSKLWTTFQTNYRTSAAYEVSVLLIESSHERKAALPVLMRGKGDRGVFSSTSLTPVLYSVKPPEPQPSARLGDQLLITGSGLDADGLSLIITSPHLTKPIAMKTSSGGQKGAIAVDLPRPSDPNVMSDWSPGFYTISAVVKHSDLPSWATNELPFALSPLIECNPKKAAPGSINLKIRCTPRLREGQKAYLLFGDRQIQAMSIVNPNELTQATNLEFFIPQADEGEYIVRLRVDGIDSLPIIRNAISGEVEFDTDLKLIVKAGNP